MISLGGSTLRDQTKPMSQFMQLHILPPKPPPPRDALHPEPGQHRVLFVKGQ